MKIAIFIIVTGVIFVILAWGFFAAQYLGAFVGGNIEQAGQWGDTFGAINALFGGLAFSGVLATLLIQQRELTKQQEQIQSAELQQHLQRFDSTFFQLLMLLRDLRKEVRARQPTGQLMEGADAFRTCTI